MKLQNNIISALLKKDYNQSEVSRNSSKPTENALKNEPETHQMLESPADLDNCDELSFRWVSAWF